MGKVTIVLNREGVRDLLLSDEMQDICEEHAQIIKNRCGEGYEYDSYKGVKRVNAMVWTDTKEAMRDNAKNNTLTKAVR